MTTQLRKELTTKLQERLAGKDLKSFTTDELDQIVGEIIWTKKHFMEVYQQNANAIKPFVERSLRSNLLDYMQSLVQKQDEMSNEDLFPVFYLIKQTLKVNLISLQTFFKLVEELIECTPEKSLENMFKVYEDITKDGQLFANVVKDMDKKSASQAVQYIQHYSTRMSRVTMNKLTVTHDLKFRGQVLTSLADRLPLTHQSGCNKQGAFNTQNQTLIEPKEGNLEKVDDSEYKVYKNFWSLQKYLLDPFLIFKTDSKNFQEQLDFEQIDVASSALGEKQNEINDADSYAAPDDVMEDMEDAGEISLQDEEEGQVNNQASIREVTFIEPADSKNTNEQQTNLAQVFNAIQFFLSKFQSQPLQVEREHAQILGKYPKFLSKFSLQKLQFDDYLFRDTFLVQVSIFLQAIQNPVKQDQKHWFKLNEPEIDQAKILESSVFLQLHHQTGQSVEKQNNQNKNSILGKRKSLGECVNNILQKEKDWFQWKNEDCKPFEMETNSDIRSKLEKRRAQKASEHQQRKMFQNREPIIKNILPFNQCNKKDHFLKSLKVRAESVVDTDFPTLKKNMIKRGAMPPISKYLYPVLMDCDPDQGIEEDYRQKNNQVFCWRFLRTISYVDLSNFSGKADSAKRGFQKFDGNIEEQALLLHEKSVKKKIVIEQEVQDEDQQTLTQENAAPKESQASSTHNQ